ncbi:6735_t:CDS:1 [Paraglomus occultum]|uniref:6735_t:CDS:1 n=1 Tax=Paraglomus occultum TaxID=144539 RepID=A0A9N8Z9K9_9GLOM|nr:6735_t:CDS:1 [Paraglomus occultum]
MANQQCPSQQSNSDGNDSNNPEMVSTVETTHNPQTNYNRDTVYPTTPDRAPTTLVSTPIVEENEETSGCQFSWSQAGVILLVLLILGVVIALITKPVGNNCDQNCNNNQSPITVFYNCVANCSNAYHAVEKAGIALMCGGSFLIICCLIWKFRPKSEKTADNSSQPNCNSDTVYPVTFAHVPAEFVSTTIVKKSKKKSRFQRAWLSIGLVLAVLLIGVGAVLFVTAKPTRNTCVQTCYSNLHY